MRGLLKTGLKFVVGCECRFNAGIHGIYIMKFLGLSWPNLRVYHDYPARLEPAWSRRNPLNANRRTMLRGKDDGSALRIPADRVVCLSRRIYKPRSRFP